jgi:protein ImuB
MLWLCLHFPLLPLEVFTRAHGDVTGPLAVTGPGHRVLCANPAATRYGITTGCSASTARALCAELRLLERTPVLEAAALQALADWAYRFTSQLALQPPDSLLLELGASLRLFGGLAPLLATVESDLAVRRYTHRSGLAPTPLAASLFAQVHPCSSHALPAGCAPGDHAAFRARLEELPIGLLQAPERQQLIMQRMGFTRIGELLALPRAALGRRFGKAVLAHLQRLCGELPDPRPAHRPREYFASNLQFLDPVPERTMLLFPMRRLLGELVQFLDHRQSFCQRLEWRLQPVRGTERVLPVSCSIEHNRDSALLELTRLALEQLQFAEAVASLALTCREFAPVQGRTADLFDGESLDIIDAERRLLDRLRLRFGPERCHGLQLADAHLPEQAWGIRESPGPACPTWAERPFWLLREPAAIVHRSGGLDWNGRLELLGGPERIEHGWWAEPQSRDYFIARHEGGALCWVYRERNGRRWFVQGVFG